MRLNPSLPLSDSFQARLAAQAILRNQFEMKKAVAELRGDIKQWRSFGQRLLAEPAVKHKLEIIMCRGDKNAQKFLGDGGRSHRGSYPCQRLHSGEGSG